MGLKEGLESMVGEAELVAVPPPPCEGVPMVVGVSKGVGEELPPAEPVRVMEGEVEMRGEAVVV